MSDLQPSALSTYHETQNYLLLLMGTVGFCPFQELCSFAIFGNFEVNKNCHFWQFLDSIITDENAKYWQKSDLSSL